MNVNFSFSDLEVFLHGPVFYSLLRKQPVHPIMSISELDQDTMSISEGKNPFLQLSNPVSSQANLEHISVY